MSGDLSGMSLGELRMRRMLGKVLIRGLKGSDDERAPAAIKRLREQMGELTAEIQRRLYPEGPPAQVIGLKTVNLRARRM